MGCWKAYRRGMEREPSFEAQEHRRLDIDRLEELYLALQPGIKRGDLKTIEAAARVLNTKGKIIGYPVPNKTAVDEGPESARGGNKEVVYPPWDNEKTISMFQEAVALLNGLEPSDEKPE
jgi:hypothetical protein